MHKAIAGLALSCILAVPTTPAFADYFVILHTQPDTGRPAERAAERIKRQLSRKCGVSANWTQTSALEDINQDLMIVFLGSYASRNRAVRARESVRDCVPGAYIKRAWWKGD